MSATYIFQWGDRISGDDGTVDHYLHEGTVTPQAPSESDLVTAIEWLALYVADDDPEIAQRFANVIGMLDRKVNEKQQRAATAQAKREYAAAHGIPVSQVRVARKPKGATS